MQKLKRGLLKMAAAELGLVIACSAAPVVSAADAPFPIAWQQSEEAGAEIQRVSYLPREKSWCHYPWNRGTETGNSVGLAGCSLLSITNSVYYKTGQFVNPTILAEYALEEGYRTPGVDGVVVTFFPGFAEDFGSACGANFIEGTSDAEKVLEHVRSGGTSCSNIYGHWVSLVDYDAENDLYLMLDSSHTSKRSANIEWTDKENGVAWLTSEELLETGKSGYYGIGERYSALFTIDYTFIQTPGDANGDGIIEISDASAVLTHYAQTAANLTPDALHPHPQQNEICQLSADVNKDSILSIEDATVILEHYARAAAGLEPSEDTNAVG